MIVNARIYTRMGVCISPKCGAARCRFFSSMQDAQHDVVLQQQARSILRKLGIAFNVLSDDNKHRILLDMQKSGIIAPMNALSAAKLFAELQNPLIAKYKLDIAQALEGARYASEAIIKATYAKDLNHRVSESRKFLEATVDPVQLEILEAFNAFNGSVLGMKEERTDIRIDHFELCSISTQIVGAGRSRRSDEPGSDREQRSPVNSEGYSASGVVPYFKHVLSRMVLFSQTVPPLSAYPPGSVLCRLDVRCDFSSTLSLDSIQKDDDDEPVGLKEEVEDSTMYTFRACISGQVPLEWRLVGVDGVGVNACKH